MSFGWYLSITLGISSLFQSVTVLGFTVALSSDIVMYTRLCIFLKQLIQPLEAQKLLIPRRAATYRAFSFRWGLPVDALAVRACLNHTERMVSGSSNGKVFRALVSLENEGRQHE